MNKTKQFIKDKFLAIFITLLLVEQFSLIVHVPIPFVHQGLNTLFLVILLVFFVYYLLVLLRRREVSKLLLIILPIFFIPIFSGIQANTTFGQPFILGFLAERLKYYVIAALFIVHALENGWITIDFLQKILLRLSVGYFIIAAIIYLFVDPHWFIHTNFVAISPHKGVKFNINQFFILFLFFYALCQILYKNKMIYLLLMAGIILYLIVFIKGRSLMFSVFLATIIFSFRKLNLRFFLSFLSLSIIGVALLVAILFIVAPGIVEMNLQLFTSALNVFLGGEVTDGSAASRITQSQTAWIGVREHFLLGNGTVSSRWEGDRGEGYEHFYPSDIGWLGVLYLYGIIGFIVLMLPFFLGFIYRNKCKVHDNSVLYYTLQVTFLYVFIHQMFAGFAVKKYGTIIFIFALLYYYRYAFSVDKNSIKNAL